MQVRDLHTSEINTLKKCVKVVINMSYSVKVKNAWNSNYLLSAVLDKT
jgi:hypothetical protein